MTPVPKARVSLATPRDLPVYVHALGTIEASGNVIVRSRVDGVILHVLFHEGDTVAENASLFEIDPPLYQAQYEQAQALLAKDEATLLRAKNDLQRGNSLAGRGLQSPSTLDQQQTTVAELEAAITADRASLAAAHTQLEWTTIRAPIAGRVGKRLVDAGNLVHAVDNTPLVDIVQMNIVNVVFAIPQEHLPRLQAQLASGELPVELRTTDDKDLIATAHSALLYNTVDLATGSIKVRALIDNDQQRLWPGEAVNVRVTVAVHKAVVSFPAQAVFEAMSGPAVYVVDRTNHIALRSIEPEAAADGLVGVSDGVTRNERVIIADQERFAPGGEVVPQVATP